ncbi:hypothetical protein SCLCIDRAFT_746624 [Scleroderma citrinum Foug A]|uniref:Uncharacterized protein n=1 Tax=Scleroderma citrinum Foug A TaxID=1036808 RepID=A0A0C3E4Y3_9AGAM|nr:hypothetical protein SCLCIDRAFT_746624 [Scleroderma citrinum Foug A]
MDNSLGLSRNNTIARISDTMQADYTDRHNVCTPNGVQVHGSDGVHRSDMQLKSNINRQHPKDGGTSCFT